MTCSCFRSSPVLDNDSPNRRDVVENISLSVSIHLKDITVRIVHAGGRIEMYQNAIPVSRLIQRYPGMCITRPDIFNSPYESVLTADDILIPGNKYFVIRSSTVEKIQRRHSRKGRNNETSFDTDEPRLVFKEIEDVGDSRLEESVCSARDFFVSKESWTSYFAKKHVKDKRQFVPPIQKPKIWKEYDWEPSLTSIQELSP